jgi:energy-coupling factor transporter ATP-binding protein EcfA2
MPGVPDGFTLEDIAAGTNLVLGPNGSGKTTLARAVRALLWPSTLSSDRVSVVGEWADGETVWIAERDGRDVRWLRDGTSYGPPPLPDPETSGCFFLGLRDLLVEDGGTDAGIAREIRRQMAGGYEPGRVRDELFPLRSTARLKEVSRLREARSEVARVRAEQRALAEEERGLRESERDRDRARRAAADLEPLRRARDLAEERGDLEDVDAELAALPPELERFRGDERERLDHLKERRRQLADEIAEATRRRDDSIAAAAAARLPDGPLDEQEWRTWSERGRKLRQRESEREAAARHAAETAGAARKARAALAGDRDVAESPPPDGEALDSLDAFLERAERLRQAGTALHHERAWLGASAGGEDAVPPYVLEEGVEILDAWLAESKRPRARIPAAGIAAALLLAGGTALALLVDPVAWGLAGVGVGLLLAAARGAVGRGAERRREEMGRRWGELGLEDPAEWSPSTVRRRRRELASARAEAVLRESARIRIDELRRREEALREEGEELAAEREAIRDTLGVDPGRSDLTLAALGRELAAWRDAERAAEAARELHEEIERRTAASRDALNAWLAGHGEPIADDAAEAETRIEGLRERSAARGHADAAREREERDLEILRKKLATTDRELEDFWRTLGRSSPDEAWLEEHIPLAERRRALVAKRTEVAAGVAKAERRLGDRDDLRGLDGTRLEERIAAAEREADRFGELQERIGRIRAGVERARKGAELESALARRDEAIEELAARREEAMRAAAGRFLVERIREEHDRAQRPAVVRRARALFDRFTGHEWSFEIDTETEPPRLRARESATLRTRSLGELSDGTRVQLLLAVRLAFAGAVERTSGGPLPLVLDEVLTTSDPERFHAVAGSLAALVRDEGRQVFYLSANPADAAAWDHRLEREGVPGAVRFDLAALRGFDRAVTDAGELVVPGLPSVPSPGDERPEDYGARLKVERFDPSRPSGEVHLFHLLRDDLPLLHRLLRNHVRTIGQWRAVEENETAEGLVGEEAAARIAARVQLVDAFIAAWRIGRGRPVDASALRDAGVSETLRPRVLELVDTQGGDARLLMQAIEAGQVKHFRRSKRDDLREYLTGEGYLDERPPLDEDGVRARVLAACALPVAGGTLASEDVARIVRELWAVARVSGRSEAERTAG